MTGAAAMTDRRAILRAPLALGAPALLTWAARPASVRAAVPGPGQPGMPASAGAAGSVSLNGLWECGFDRGYQPGVQVPGISQDPAVMRDELLWYRRTVVLPAGTWSACTLELKGARFLPAVYIDGEAAGRANGGMAPANILLDHRHLVPGATVVLEIALASLKHVDPGDASYIPVYDQWRANVSSALWDDVVLHLHGTVRVTRIIPFSDAGTGRGAVKIELGQADDFRGRASVHIVDAGGRVVIRAAAPVTGPRVRVEFALGGKLRHWSPDQPTLYRLRLEIHDASGRLHDARSIHYAVRTFAVRDKQFYLNDRRIVPRGTSVCFHRWTRSREGVELAYDEAWFTRNILQRSRDLGANYIRFHLGAPPERLLDLCDRHGMLVQFEWSFFHGMPATLDSLLEQYRNWLDLAVRHPCVVLIHPYNETEGRQLKTAWIALDRLLVDYPPMVLEDRDVIHVHKYWWSLFENLGLYYDDARAFPKVVMADEFGGNYLDRDGNPGQYPTVKESFMRFLGRDHTRAERLAFHAESNGKVAEYWRRIGAGGFSPFTALGSDQDGSNWFLGPLREGRPMPVWQALAPAFSPQAASIELWDRHFVPGQSLDLPVYLFNEEAQAARLAVQVTLEDRDGKVVLAQRRQQALGANARLVLRVPLTLPAQSGEYTLKAEVLNPPPAIKAAVVSAWDVRVVTPVASTAVRGLKVAVAPAERELRALLNAHGIAAVAQDDATADVVMTSTAGWRAIAGGDGVLAGALEAAIGQGKSVIMLDIGTRRLGQGYPRQAGDLGPLQGVAQVAHPEVTGYPLFGGMSVKLTETAEPESHLHPARAQRLLWGAMPDRVTRLWNGMRGGLIVPAEDMALTGLSAAAYVTGWQERGADPVRVAQGPYFAYELQGFYSFSDRVDDCVVADQLRQRVRFLVQDAPALAVAINPDSPQSTTDLHQGYLAARGGQARELAPLATAGKSLTRTPVALVDFGPGKGRLIVSQLLTAGRLAPGYGEAGLYGIRYDPVAVQMVLNMLDLLRR